MTTEYSNKIEVWVRQSEGIGIDCEVVNEDETTTTLDIEALSLEGGRREVTGFLISRDFKPVGRWEETAKAGSTALEYKRTFARAS